jgi:hypothetical protein
MPLAACHDSVPTLAESSPKPSSAVAFLEIASAPGDGQFIARARVWVGPGLRTPSAFVVSLVLPRGVTADSALMPSNGDGMRLANVVGTEVRVAGALMTGTEELFALRLQSAERATLSHVRLVIHELTDERGFNLGAVVRVTRNQVAAQAR